MSRPSDHHHAGLGDVEGALRDATVGFPGVLPAGGTLDAIVGRGRRARTMGRATRLGAAASLLAGAAFAAPAILQPSNDGPTVLNHLDEQVSTEEGTDVAPDIVVHTPADNSVVTTPRVQFAGEVEDDAEVTVGPYDVEVAPDGRWRIELEVELGTQTFTFWATDRAGNRGFDQVTVTYRTDAVEEPVEEEPVEEPPAEEAKEPAPVVVPVKADPEPAPKHEEPKQTSPTTAFTAHQKYGSCSEAVPYDEFNGTAKPGTQVWIYSEYGEKKTTVNANGEWYVKVEFPNAPQGVTFQVKAKSLHTGEKKFFEFVNTGEGGSHGEVAFTAKMENNHVEYDPPYSYFSGTSSPGTTVWVESEYGGSIATADGSGNWRVKVWFEDAPYGTNTWAVVVETSNGDRKVFEYTGIRPEPNHSFTANMENNHVEHDPPYSYFSGTAAPGTNIHVASDHGSARTEAAGDGKWRVKVWFENAPYGTHTWSVVVESDAGDRKVFEFTGTRPEAAPSNYTSDQVHDVTDDNPPHSQYVGTANPGDKVHVFSEYGEGFVYADDAGHWSLWVEFPNAPRGSSFTVNVKHWDSGEIHQYVLQVV